MARGFHAGFVHADALVRRLSFADQNNESSEHYFIMDRSEASPEVAMPDLANVYIEIDDQGWGGYGGIEWVVLARDSLTLQLGPRWAIGDDQIQITFAISEAELQELRRVLRLIMRGYESRLECAV